MKVLPVTEARFEHEGYVDAPGLSESERQLVGALAELCGEFYKQLLRQGFQPAEALHFTSEWVRAIVTPPQKNNP